MSWGGFVVLLSTSCSLAARKEHSARSKKYSISSSNLNLPLKGCGEATIWKCKSLFSAKRKEKDKQDFVLKQRKSDNALVMYETQYYIIIAWVLAVREVGLGGGDRKLYCSTYLFYSTIAVLFCSTATLWLGPFLHSKTIWSFSMTDFRSLNLNCWKQNDILKTIYFDLLINPPNSFFPNFATVHIINKHILPKILLLCSKLLIKI